MEKKLDQAKYRRGMYLVDQFNRKYGTMVDKESGFPASGINPDGWSDPLETPQKYIRMVQDSEKRPIPGKCHIHTDEWIDDQRRATKEWFRLLHVAAQQAYKKLTPEMIADLENDSYLTDIVGPKPFPSPEQIEEYVASVNPNIAPEALTYADFMKEGRAKGHEVQQIALAWKAHKENLQEV